MFSQEIKTQDYQFETWFGYINSLGLNNNWRIWNDVHFIPQNFAIYRYGLTYRTSKSYNITLGHAYLQSSTPHKNYLNRSEHRVWGEINKNFKLNTKFRYNTRYRYDGRFRQKMTNEGYVDEQDIVFNHRHRLMNQIRYYFYTSPQKNYFFTGCFNEVLYQSGKEIQNSFDQIRNFVFMGYQTNSLTILAGYHQRHFVSFSPYKINSGFTIWFIHSIDLYQ